VKDRECKEEEEREAESQEDEHRVNITSVPSRTRNSVRLVPSGEFTKTGKLEGRDPVRQAEVERAS
jgi:hypothetical protein